MKPLSHRVADFISARSLFLKIFGWFLATQILIAVVLYVLAATTQRGYDERFTEIMGDNLEAKVYAAAVAYEAGGLEALREAWQTPRERRPRRGRNGENFNQRGPGGGRGGGRGGRDFGPDGPRRGNPPRPDELRLAAFYVLQDTTLNPNATLLAGPPPPIDLTPPPTQQQTTYRVSGQYWLARRTRTTKGKQYLGVVLMRFPGERPGGGLFPPRMIGRPRANRDAWLQLLVIVLTIGAVCYSLARYLTDPAIKLRRATTQFASGDLSARVGPQIGRRRDELADLGRDFDQMAERIQSLLLAERRLLGDISHELRSPLTRLCLALELAEQTADAQTGQQLERIGSEAQEINNLISQLLTLTRLENSPSITQSQNSSDAAFIDLQHLVKHVCDNANFEARSRGGEVQILTSQECQIVGNGELLHSAVENVVRNAILHSPQSPRVEVSLQIETRQENSKTLPTREAVISVRDCGRGVPEEALALLFSPFYRVASARDRQSGGTGLGLSITQRAVQFHGGQVKAENALGGGLVVKIRLPLSDEDVPALLAG